MVIELNIADDAVAFVFENAIRQVDVNEVKRRILDKLSERKNVSLYLEEDDVDEIKLRAFFDQVFFDIKHSDRIDKVAIVTDRTWIQTLSRIKDRLISSDVRVYDLKERVDAVCWIMSPTQLMKGF